MNFIDQLQRNVSLKTSPKRIVCLVPSQTELLVYLGLQNNIVGITKFCVHPKNLRQQKTIVGGTKAVNIDKIKALKPNIILCNKEENTKAIVNALAKVAPVHVSDIETLESCYNLITMYGTMFKVEIKAQQLITDIKQQRQWFKNTLFNPLKVAYFIWKKPWMVAASQNFINTMLKEAGFSNVFLHLKRYPEIALTDSALQKADAILLSSEPFPFKQQHVVDLKTYFPNTTIITVDGELFSWYGSRLLYSYSYFKDLRKQLE